MWTANIVETTRVNNELKILVGFTNGTISTSEEYRFTTPNLENLKTLIRNKIDILNIQDSFSLPLGPINTTPITSTLTQAQIDQQQFQQDYALWLQVKRGIDAQVLTGNEAPVIALKNKVQTTFKPSYLNLL